MKHIRFFFLLLFSVFTHNVSAMQFDQKVVEEVDLSKESIEKVPVYKILSNGKVLFYDKEGGLWLSESTRQGKLYTPWRRKQPLPFN